jgi:hypothetical protein
MLLKEVELRVIDNQIYILSDDSDSELFVFSINGELTVAYFDDLLGDQINWVKPVLVEPNEIGWVNEGVNEGIFKITPLNDKHIDIIQSNGGVCSIEINEDSTPLLLESKVIIHI